MNLTRTELDEIRCILNANSEKALIEKLETLKKHIIETSKKYYTARIILGSSRHILCTKDSGKIEGLEVDFYSAIITRKIYYFNSIEEIITRLLEVEILPYFGKQSIEIWQESDAGEDKLLFKIVQV